MKKDHPAVKRFLEQAETAQFNQHPEKLDANLLRTICLDAGADDVGFIEIDRPELSEERNDLLELMVGAKSVASLAFRLNREPLRSNCHSVANIEFGHAWRHANKTGRLIVRKLQSMGIRALNAAAGFPYEPDRWPGKMWLTSDKVLAREAGLGRMGWNRILLHPEFGAAVVLGNVLMDAELTAYHTTVQENPCIECKLCVSVCPVGAIGKDGRFDFFSCYTHNYRERLGGFADWLGKVIASKTVKAYRQSVTDSETISMWQNLSIGGQTRCDRCVAVCPAGTDALGPFLSDRKWHLHNIVKRMQDKKEAIYAVRGSDAEAYVKARFPSKSIKNVSNGLRPSSAAAFLRSLPLVFQRGQSEGLAAIFHFTFTGEGACNGTVIIRDKEIHVLDGLHETPDLQVIADSKAWVDFLAKERNLPWALITRQIRLKGNIRLMPAFAKCFPS
jgi:epoxyqueuosine reductase QueG